MTGLKIGYARRRYERDAHGEGWQDGPLIDVLAEELPRGSTNGPRPRPAARARPTSTGLMADHSLQIGDQRALASATMAA